MEDDLDVLRFLLTAINRGDLQTIQEVKLCLERVISAMESGILEQPPSNN